MKDQEAVLQIRKQIEEYIEILVDKPPTDSGVQDILVALNRLEDVDIDREILQNTRIGAVLTKLSKNPSDKIDILKSTAAKLTAKWKQKLQKQLGAKEPPVDVPNKRQKTDSAADSSENEPTYQYLVHNQDIRDKALQYLFKSFLTGNQGNYDHKQVSKLVYDIEGGLFENYLLNSSGHKEYTQKLKSIAFNLKDPKNTAFNDKIYKGNIKAASVATMESAEMASDEKKMERINILQESLEACQSDWAVKNILLSKDGKKKGQFKCFKCKSTETVYYQMQTRSSDEPMTTFVTCLQCNNRWKF